MTSVIDINISERESDKLFDIAVAGDGDLVLDESFDTALKMSLYEERRADPSEVPTAHLRRGWWGNELDQFPDFEIGSKLWLIYQQRITPTLLNRAINYAQESLTWLIDDGFLDDVRVTGQFIDNGIRLRIDLLRDQSVADSRWFDIWKNTGSLR